MMKSNTSNPVVQLGLPCKHSISSMDADEKGYHCASCSKHLIDFRDKSPEAIHAIIQNSNQHICGVFYKHQVDYKVSTVTFSKVKTHIGLSLLGILGFLGPVLQSCETPTENVTIKKQHAFNNLKFPMYLKGTLVDEKTNNPLANSPIKILQNGKVILSGKTDKSGNFELTIQEDDLKSEVFDLAYSAQDYISDTLKAQKMTKIKSGEKIKLTIQATPESCGKIIGKIVDNTAIPVPGEPIIEGEIIAPIEPIPIVNGGLTTPE